MVLGGGPGTVDIARRWVTAGDPRMLRAPIGTNGEGEAVVLDIKESAWGGSGPHGLIVGATGNIDSIREYSIGAFAFASAADRRHRSDDLRTAAFAFGPAGETEAASQLGFEPLTRIHRREQHNRTASTSPEDAVLLDRLANVIADCI
ncbi:hypothetical protein [Actinoplanes sp. NBRC 103695]|uniref:hypothetical protein n=1 Tax=Actinoplanes sp. NBRC 103695 TaxID=3032202 RepID=UPI00249FB4D0|nr:hypothetical protein [Actinoplanes sp. NBRC 103695]GLY97271.1 hypothetical protein Acsp02_45250 [Actinoplanes sp. NBRC 103695]